MESVKNAINNEYFCHDCGKKIETENDEIKGGVQLAYKNGDEIIKIFKCDECYSKNPKLTNYQDCEVYSRVVGYIRPVSQWHKGKKEEYAERKEYKECC